MARVRYIFFIFLRQEEDHHDDKYTLLVHEPMLGDLETTTTQRPFVTQSLSPIENREALSQLVSLYEQVILILKFKVLHFKN